VPHRLDRGRGLVDSLTVQQSLRIGIGATDIKRALLLTATLSPAAVGANTTAEQTFTLTGVLVGDMITVNKPSAQAGLSIAGVRVSATDQVAITFGNHTGGSLTPTASQMYRFIVLRP
jgi:hypothetical protein